MNLYNFFCFNPLYLHQCMAAYDVNQGLGKKALSSVLVPCGSCSEIGTIHPVSRLECSVIPLLGSLSSWMNGSETMVWIYRES